MTIGNLRGLSSEASEGLQARLDDLDFAAKVGGRMFHAREAGELVIANHLKEAYLDLHDVQGVMAPTGFKFGITQRANGFEIDEYLLMDGLRTEGWYPIDTGAYDKTANDGEFIFMADCISNAWHYSLQPGEVHAYSGNGIGYRCKLGELSVVNVYPSLEMPTSDGEPPMAVLTPMLLPIAA